MNNNVAPYQRGYSEDDEIDLYEILDIILKKKTLVVVITVLGCILSFIGAKYYSNNIKKNKYAQDFSINYGIFNDGTLVNAGNFKVIPILSLLNDDDVINEFYTIENLNKSYQDSLKKSTDKDEEMAKKRKYLKKILEIEPLIEKQDEISFGYKKYLITSISKKNKELSQGLISKFMGLVEKKVDDEFTKKIAALEEFNRSTKTESQKALQNEKTSEMNDELQNMKIENVDSVMKYSNPALYVSINENLKKYEESATLESRIDLTKEKLKNSKIVEKNTSIYEVEVKSYTLIILAVGGFLSFCLGIFAAFMSEFWNNYKKKKI